MAIGIAVPVVVAATTTIIPMPLRSLCSSGLPSRAPLLLALFVLARTSCARSRGGSSLAQLPPLARILHHLFVLRLLLTLDRQEGVFPDLGGSVAGGVGALERLERAAGGFVGRRSEKLRNARR